MSLRPPLWEPSRDSQTRWSPPWVEVLVVLVVLVVPEARQLPVLPSAMEAVEEAPGVLLLPALWAKAVPREEAVLEAPVARPGPLGPAAPCP